jgi:hypothetical protein
MIKDIHRIRQELEGFVEVSQDYEFKKNILIKYLTRKGVGEEAEEGFSNGGSFKFRGNNCLMVEKNNFTWPIRIHHLNPDASIQYTTRFFIKESDEPEPHIETSLIKELQGTISYQQGIIETMTDSIKSIEMQKHQVSSDKSDYEGLLEQNRHHLKELSIELREVRGQNDKYRNIIQTLSQSHPMMG